VPDETAVREGGPPPQTIGRYVVDHELGRGMMGVVYAAHDSVLGRTVALKTIELAFPAGPSEREDFEHRFFTEARIAAKLSHPGIVVCHDVGKDTETGKLFIVFEHLRGETLAARVARGQPLPWAEAAAIVAKVARAIHHAHEHGVVHRDLKPANIMQLESGETKIMDFGVAKLETSRIKLTATGQSFGSPLYMSPEQALGHPSDARSDVFSLGSILCTLLLGTPCFDAENVPKILARVIRDEAPMPSRLRPGVPSAIDGVIARAMAKSVDDRYPDAERMADDLEDVLGSRLPRHALGYTPRPGDGTVPAGFGPEHDALLAELTGPAKSPDAGAETVDPLEALASLVEPAPEAAAADPARSTRRLAIAAAVVCVGVVVVSSAALFAWRRSLSSRPSPASAPAASSETEAPDASMAAPTAALPTIAAATAAATTAPTAAATATPAPRTRPPKAAAATERTPPVQAAATETVEPAVAPAGTRMRLAVEHPLESGHLTLWIDGALRYESELKARTTRKGVVGRVPDGRLEESVEVAPGKHQIRVEVAWESNRKSETIVGTFEPNETRDLLVRVGGLTKGLSLDWKR
jgi:hypothetical protein